MKRFSSILVMIALVGLLTWGCSCNVCREKAPAPPPKQGPVVQEEQKQPVPSVEEAKPAPAPQVDVEALAKSFEQKDIHFDFDKYDLKPEARATLKELANFLLEHPEYRVRIEGHCDERGTEEYNLALGEKRANAAKDYLVSLGVSPDRIDTISYGENRPLCTEHNESCWWRNRRDHFVLIRVK